MKNGKVSHPNKLAILALFVLAVLNTVASSNACDADLPRKLKSLLEQEVFPAMQNGAYAYFYDAFGPILAKANDKRLQLIEEYAESLRLQSPTDLFFDLKLMRVEQGIESLNEKIRLKEAMLLINQVNLRLQKIVSLIEEHDFMQDPVEVDEQWKNAQEQFWGIQVINNEFSNSQRLLLFARAIQEAPGSSIRRSEDPTTLKTLEELVRLDEKLNSVYQDLEERSAEARLIRFQRSATAIRGSNNFKNKFLAALSLQIDADILVPYLQNNLKSDREALNRPDLVAELSTEIAELSTIYSDVISKANKLRTGLNWWMRGRYGEGVEAGGLLKSSQLVAQSGSQRGLSMSEQQIRFEALDALYMPHERPKPEIGFTPFGATPTKSNKVGEGNSPRYSRRHFFTWSLERRRILVNSEIKTDSVGTRQRPVRFFSSSASGNNTVRSTIMRRTKRTVRRLEEANVTLPFRIVGTHEYSNSLDQLIPLIQESTPEQVRLYDEIVTDQDELSFFSGVILTASTNQNLSNAQNDTPLTERFRRRGLKWLMALARIELGATKAMYTAENPFESLAPKDGFGRQEYFDLLAHDSADHMNALKTDPVMFLKSTKLSAVESVPYIRRLKVVNDMLTGASRAEDGRYASYSSENLKRLEKPMELFSFNLAIATLDSVQTEFWEVAGH